LTIYGYFSKEDLNVSWEKTDKIEKLKEAIKNIR
jgi:S-adenosylmethionine synthetase